jgi:hypothetical protein
LFAIWRVARPDVHHYPQVDIFLAHGADVVLDVAQRSLELFLVVDVDVVNDFLLAVVFGVGRASAKARLSNAITDSAMSFHDQVLPRVVVE